MGELSPNAFKCYVVIVRKTTGWGKESDKISIPQFMQITGIKKRDTVIAALVELEKFDLVLPCKNCGKVNEYFLKKIPENITDTSPENGDLPSPKKGYQSRKWGPAQSQKRVPVPKMGT